MKETTTKELEQAIAEHAAILPGEPQAVSARGEDFTIKPFKFPQYGKAIKAVTRILSILNLKERFEDIAKSLTAEQGEDAEIPLGDLLGGLLDFEAIAKVCDEAPEEIIALMMVATGKPRDWFDELEADEGIELAGAVLGVNLSFFIQRIVPAIVSAANRVKAGLSQRLTSSQTSNPETESSTVGQTQSPNSANTLG